MSENVSTAERFLRFADECRHASPLYARLSEGVADDPMLLDLAAQGRPDQPAPNLLFGAVHGLLLQGVTHPLAAFYPSLGGTARLDDGLLPAFHDFCVTHRAALGEIVATRTVQTNEVRRSACLLPAFALLARRSGRPLSLIEIGASAGLNLLWDRYGYDYGPGGQVGDHASPLQITCELRGPVGPPLLDPLPAIASRVGVDLHPIDVRDEAAVCWLYALIWPEQVDRMERLRNAMTVARSLAPLTLVAGDALAALPDLLTAAPADTTLCLYDTFVINQFSTAGRARLEQLLCAYSMKRAIFRISIHWQIGSTPVIDLLAYMGGRTEVERLGRCDGHGGWLEWAVGSGVG